MGKKINFLGVIPARGGSKGIPRKNIKMIAGRPLIAWTIEAARQSRRLDSFVVSTEDKEIADIARRFKAGVIERPPELATDEATTLSVLQHALENINAKAIVILQPTSPIRDAGLIDNCILNFQEKKADNLATGLICKFKEYGSYTQRRQELKGFFYDDGNVYVVKAGLIKKGTLFGDNAVHILTSREQNIEIDDDFDFWLAEQALLKRMAQKV
jgi:CMP-N-acetylneuraminic acid synthetase